MGCLISGSNYNSGVKIQRRDLKMLSASDYEKFSRRRIRDSSGDKIPLEENYEKKLGASNHFPLCQENQPMRRRGLAKHLSHHSKKLSFSFHNIVRPHMFLREGML